MHQANDADDEAQAGKRRLNVQRRSDLWEATHSPRERERINAPARWEALREPSPYGCGPLGRKML